MAEKERPTEGEQTAAVTEDAGHAQRVQEIHKLASEVTRACRANAGTPLPEDPFEDPPLPPGVEERLARIGELVMQDGSRLLLRQCRLRLPPGTLVGAAPVEPAGPKVVELPRKYPEPIDPNTARRIKMAMLQQGIALTKTQLSVEQFYRLPTGEQFGHVAELEKTNAPVMESLQPVLGTEKVLIVDASTGEILEVGDYWLRFDDRGLLEKGRAEGKILIQLMNPCLSIVEFDE